MTHALITGGAGFIGSHLACALLRQGIRVRVLDDLSLGHEANLTAARALGEVEFRRGDAGEAATLRAALDGCDAVFHLAALPSVPRSVAAPLPSHTANLTATVTLLELCREHPVQRVLFAGSSSVYGDQAVARKPESLPPQPRSPYALQKYAAEQYGFLAAEHHRVPFVSLRFFNVFGPRQAFDSPYAGVIAKFCTAFLKGENPVIFGDGHQSRDFTYVDNVIDGLMRAAVAPAERVVGRAFNLACGDRIELLQLVRDLGHLTGHPLEPRFLPPRPGDVQHSCADITAARQVLGYQPRVDWLTGLGRTLDWYRQAGPTV